MKRLTALAAPIALGALLAPLALASTSAPAAPTVTGDDLIGTTVSHTFRDPVLGARGVASLDDLRGRPVLIDFWGKR